MKKSILSGSVILAVVILMTSCSSVPKEKIDAANAALDSVKVAGAETYLPDEFFALQDSLNSAMQLVEGSKSKLFGSNSEAKARLDAVISTSAQLIENTAQKKQEVLAEVENLLSEIGQLIQDDNALVLSAPKGKEGTAALEAIKGEISALENSVTETETLLEDGEYMSALSKSEATKIKAESIKAELSEVIAKYKQAAKRK